MWMEIVKEKTVARALNLRGMAERNSARKRTSVTGTVASIQAAIPSILENLAKTSTLETCGMRADIRVRKIHSCFNTSKINMMVNLPTLRWRLSSLSMIVSADKQRRQCTSPKQKGTYWMANLSSISHRLSELEERLLEDCDQKIFGSKAKAINFYALQKHWNRLIARVHIQ